MHKTPTTRAPFAIAAAVAISLLSLTARAQTHVPTPPATDPTLPTDAHGTFGLAHPSTTGIGTNRAVSPSPSDSPATAESVRTSATPMGIARQSADAHAQPSEAEMMEMMMAMGKVNENHKLLAELVGNWSYVVKMWMAPGAPPIESKGTATRKAEMGDRYFIARATGKFPMPGPDGKMTDVDFEGMSIEGYDNAKQKFFSTWIDNMGTGILLAEGSYDAATKTFTYDGEYAMAPGMKMKVREVVRVTDKDHYAMEYFEVRGSENVKTMEIAYTRTK